MNRVEDAKSRLEALHQPVPRPTKNAVAQNKAEEDSRRETGMFGKVMRNFQKHPDVAQATKVGDPTLVNPQMVSATEVVQKASRAMMGTSTPGDNNAVSVEVGKGAPPENQAAPRSDTLTPATPVDNSAAPPPVADPNELKPNVAADPNELKPNVADESGQTLSPPQQVNELAPGANPATPEAAKTDDGKTTDAASAGNEPADETAVSSSKRKKKKGLRKIVPF
jgi:hypothetical protein